MKYKKNERKEMPNTHSERTLHKSNMYSSWYHTLGTLLPQNKTGSRKGKKQLKPYFPRSKYTLPSPETLEIHILSLRNSLPVFASPPVFRKRLVHSHGRTYTTNFHLSHKTFIPRGNSGSDSVTSSNIPKKYINAFIYWDVRGTRLFLYKETLL